MSEEQSFIDYQLETSIMYHFKGDEVEGGFISLYPPSSKNIKECCELKQAFFRSLPKNDATKPPVEDEKDEDAGITGEAIIGLISMSDKVELSHVLLTARELFKSGVALMEGETKLTTPMLDKLSIDDLEGMVGEYMAVFILASALKKMNKV